MNPTRDSSLMLFLPFVLGGMMVFQAGLNRVIGQQVGWSVVGLINNTCGWITALLITVVIMTFFRGEGINIPSGFTWWWVLPGFLGMLYIIGMPFSIQHLGSSKAYVVLVTSQMLFTLIWDKWALQMDVPWNRVVGLCIAIAGAVIASFR